MKMLARLLYLIDIINELMGQLFSFFTPLLLFIVLYDTGMRFIFDNPPVWGMELSTIILLTMVCLGGGYCLLHGGHIRVDILYNNLPLRVRASLDLVTHLLLLTFCWVVIKYGGELFWEAFQTGELSSETSWEYIRWPVLMLIPLSGVLLGLQALAKWIRDLVILCTGENHLESKVVKGEGGLRG